MAHLGFEEKWSRGSFVEIGNEEDQNGHLYFDMNETRGGLASS